MPRYTVAREGNHLLVDGEPQPAGTVYVDGVAHPVDCSSLPVYFHALQWYGDTTPPWGEIEYAPDAQGNRMPNTRFNDFAPYQYLVDAWEQYEPPPPDNPELDTP